MKHLKTPEIVVSIVIYNSFISSLKNLLKALNKSTVDLEIHIIDNSQLSFQKENERFVKKLNHYNPIIYIKNEKNLGFAKAHNLSLRESINRNIKYHLVLNPDVQIPSETLPKLLAFMDSEKEIGLLTPKVLNMDGSIQYNCRLLPSPTILFLRRFLKLKKINYLYELQFTGYKQIMEVPWICGCFMLMRTEILKKIGIFDERFFLYMEDVDLSRRIYKTAKVIFYPNTYIYHEAQRGSYKDTKLLKYHIISAIKYFNKWGWFFDKEREQINKEVLEKLGWSRVK